MKLTIQLKLLPTPPQKAELLLTMERFNEAASFAAKVGFDARVYGQVKIHHLAYRQIREKYGLTAQMAVRAIAKAVEAFQINKKVCPVFRPRGAICYDQRVLSFKGLTEVSLWALSGRLRIPFVCGAYQDARKDRIKGQSDLIYRDGTFFLHCTTVLPEAEPQSVQEFIGVDLGMVSIATTSDGESFDGKAIDDCRRRHTLQRGRLQRKGTKGAKKKLKRIRSKESRFRRHNNHVISKSIVQTAQRTGRGIACEDLTGIRSRVTVRGGEARRRLSSWSFSQLYLFLEYKAKMAGVPLVKVDPRYTSRTCSKCGHNSKTNRKSQAKFLCGSCGYSANADVNAAENISALAKIKLAKELVGPNSA